MDVEDFVAQSLKQVLSGIKKAQSEPDGDNINAKFGGGEVGGNLIHAHAYGMFTRVDFDIAVTAETTGKAGAGIKIWVVGAEGAAEHKAGTASRLSFSVPLRLPDGDATRSDEVDRKSRAAMRRSDQSDSYV